MTGTAAPGLAAAEQKFAIGRYRLPTPRVAFGTALVGVATACIDVSDGLVADLGHIAVASGIAATVMLEAFVWSAAVARAGPAYPEADRLTAGDDYELLFTAPPDRRAAVEDIAAATGVPLQRIGRIEDGSGVRVLDRDGTALAFERTGFRHR